MTCALPADIKATRHKSPIYRQNVTLTVQLEYFHDVRAEIQSCFLPRNYVNLNTTFRVDKRGVWGIMDPKGWFGKAYFLSLTDEDINVPIEPEVKVAERNRAIENSDAIQGVTTLGFLASEWMRRSKEKLRVQVPTEFASKTVCVYGSEFAAPKEVLRAGAAVYGLRLVAYTNKFASVISPPVPSAEKIADLPEAIRALLPECYGRALHVKEMDAPRPELTNAARTSMARNPKAFMEFMRRKSNLGSRPGEMRLEAIRRLLFSIHHRPGKANEDIPVMELTVDEKKDIAAILMAKALPSFRTMVSQHQPAYLSDWNQLALGGNIEADAQGEKTYHLFLCIPNPSQPNKMMTTNGIIAGPE